MRSEDFLTSCSVALLTDTTVLCSMSIVQYCNNCVSLKFSGMQILPSLCAVSPTTAKIRPQAAILTSLQIVFLRLQSLQRL